MLITLLAGAWAARRLCDWMLGTDGRLLAEFPKTMDCSIACAGGQGGASGGRHAVAPCALRQKLKVAALES
jgi:hypothetical protein